MLPAKPIDDSAHGAAAALNAGKFANGDEEKALEIQAEALTVGLGLNGTGKVPLSVGFARGTHLQYDICCLRITVADARYMVYCRLCQQCVIVPCRLLASGEQNREALQGCRQSCQCHASHITAAIKGSVTNAACSRMQLLSWILVDFS